jgi:hypothetical protein
MLVGVLKKLNVSEEWAVITYVKEKVAIFVGLTTLRAFNELFCVETYNRRLSEI